jgi:hypothetical protein
LPASATEWIDSASIEAAPVNTNATNLAIAIPRLARNAAKIARVLPSFTPAVRWRSVGNGRDRPW